MGGNDSVTDLDPWPFVMITLAGGRMCDCLAKIPAAIRIASGWRKIVTAREMLGAVRFFAMWQPQDNRSRIPGEYTGVHDFSASRVRMSLAIFGRD